MSRKIAKQESEEVVDTLLISDDDEDPCETRGQYRQRLECESDESDLEASFEWPEEEMPESSRQMMERDERQKQQILALQGKAEKRKAAVSYLISLIDGAFEIFSTTLNLIFFSLFSGYRAANDDKEDENDELGNHFSLRIQRRSSQWTCESSRYSVVATGDR